MNERLLKPDLAILFEGERKLESAETTHKHEQNKELMEKCRTSHEMLADKFGWKRMKVEKEIEDTAKNLWNIVSKYLNEIQYGN
jgi:hypothetical protein